MFRMSFFSRLLVFFVIITFVVSLVSSSRVDASLPLMTFWVRPFAQSLILHAIALVGAILYYNDRTSNYAVEVSLVDADTGRVELRKVSNNFEFGFDFRRVYVANSPVYGGTIVKSYSFDPSIFPVHSSDGKIFHTPADFGSYLCHYYHSSTYEVIWENTVYCVHGGNPPSLAKRGDLIVNDDNSATIRLDNGTVIPLSPNPSGDSGSGSSGDSGSSGSSGDSGSGSSGDSGSSGSSGDSGSSGNSFLDALRGFFGSGDGVGQPSGDDGFDDSLPIPSRDSITDKIFNFMSNNPLVSIFKSSSISASPDVCSFSTVVYGKEVTISFCELADKFQLIGSILLIVVAIYSFLIAWGRA